MSPAVSDLEVILTHFVEKRLEAGEVTMIHPSHKQITAKQRLSPLSITRPSSSRTRRSRSSSAMLVADDSSDEDYDNGGRV